MTSPRSNDPVESSNAEKEMAFLLELVKHLQRMVKRDAEHEKGKCYYITVNYKDGPVCWFWHETTEGSSTLHKENTDKKTEVNFKHRLLLRLDAGSLTRGPEYDFIDCLQLLTEVRKHTILDVLADV